MLQFDDGTARLLEEAYKGADFTRRRRANFDALAPGPSERLLDLGCGNGILTLDLSRSVGPEGHVHGVDPSPAMLDSARGLCAGRDNITLIEGTAAALPLEDASVDGIVSVQVFEYIEDLDGALIESHRVLRPGGRLVLGDLHFGTCAWFSEDPHRMAQMLAAWDRHFVHPALLRELPALLAQAGLRVVDVRPETVFDKDLRPDGLARMMMTLMADYAVRTGQMAEDDALRWAGEQEALARDGRFCFSLTHFVVVAKKPRGPSGGGR